MIKSNVFIDLVVDKFSEFVEIILNGKSIGVFFLLDIYYVIFINDLFFVKLIKDFV